MREEIYFCVKEIITYNDFCALQQLFSVRC